MWLAEKQEELKDKKSISGYIFVIFFAGGNYLVSDFFEYLESMGTIDNDYYPSGRVPTEYGVQLK